MYDRLHPMPKFDAFTPSEYQQAILEWLMTGKGNAIVNAVWGSGKSTTLVWLSQYIDNALFLAFNNSVVDSLNGRLKDTTTRAQTIHSLGFAMLRAVYKNAHIYQGGNKYKYLVGDFINSALDAQAALPELNAAYRVALQTRLADDKTHLWPFKQQLIKLCEKVRITLTDWYDIDALDQLCWAYDIELDEQDYLLIPILLQLGLDQITTLGRCDFADQIFAPVYLDLPPTKTYGFVMIDEAQDLNELQLKLVSKIVGGRVLAVGDPAQSIYSFSGAMHDSFFRVKSHFNMVELPLSVCYRCPTSHLELVRPLVPHVKAAPNALKGEVIEIDSLEQMLGDIQEGDLILCRITAGCIATAVELLKHQIPARVMGQDICKNLLTILDKVEQLPAFDFRRVGYFMQQYASREVEKLSRKANSEAAIATLQDKIEALTICATSFEVNTMPALKLEIDNLFDATRKGVQIGTIHKNKGNEVESAENTVWIVRPDKLPLRFPGMNEEQVQEEWHVVGVALTRGKNRVVIVRHEGKGLDLSGMTAHFSATLPSEAPQLGPDEQIAPLPAILSDKLGVPVTLAPAIDAPYYELTTGDGSIVVQQSSSKPNWTPNDFKTFALARSVGLPAPFTLWQRTDKGNVYLWSCANGHELPPPPVTPSTTIDSIPTDTRHLPTPRGFTRGGGMLIRKVSAEVLTVGLIALYLSIQLKG